MSLYYEQQKLKGQDPGMSQAQLAFQGNEAGPAAAVATVEQLTGVHIDHFAEVNLDGFYELARVLGGVEVCLNHATSDSNSGANFRPATSTWIRGRHWRSCASATACPTATWTAPIGSRRSWTPSCSSCGPRAP